MGETKDEVQGEVVATEAGGEGEVVEGEKIHKIQHLGRIWQMKMMRAWVMKRITPHLSQDCMYFLI